MSTTPRASARHRLVDGVDYPTADGRPMGETDLHRQDMMDVITALEDRFAADPLAYVSGNLLLFYERGNRRRHISPDAFVVFGVPKRPPRDYYLLWLEGKGPDVVIEITSKTTRREDQRKKLELYRDVLKVPEYFQFDPTEDYLRPSLQGHRLVEGRYEPIEPVDGRIPSRLLGLELERAGTELRLVDPTTGQRLPTRREWAEEAERQAEEARRLADEERRHTEEARRLAEEAQRQADEARHQADEERRHADEARHHAEEAQRQADEARRHTEEAQRQADEERRQAEEAQRQADEERRHAEEARQREAETATENERLRRELDALRRRLADAGE